MKLLYTLIILLLSCSTEPEDCAGVAGGNSYLDDCGGCDANVNNDCIQDCEGVWGGGAVLSGCDNLCNSTKVDDECGVCGGDNSCLDCAGIIKGSAVELFDNCYSILTDTLNLTLSAQFPDYCEQINWEGFGCPDVPIEWGLDGEIPSEIGNLINLKYLNLSGNRLSGEIPSSIGNLINLEYLNLSGNRLILDYTTMEFILNGNQLSGEIPSSIGNLINLNVLDLGYNLLSGEIPSSIGNLINLTGLDLGYNEITGSIPSELGNLTNLTSMNLYNTLLSGEIPQEVCALFENNFSNNSNYIHHIFSSNNLINTCE